MMRDDQKGPGAPASETPRKGEPPYILASASPRRADLLQRAGFLFSVFSTDIDEARFSGLPPIQRVTALAEAKLRAALPSGAAPAVVIAADTLVVLGTEILGKPADEADAGRMLRLLSGRTHTVHTGVAVARAGAPNLVRSACVSTEVDFRALTDCEIDAYIATGEPLDKAGAYGIQGKGGLFCRAVRGDYHAVVGLPLCRLGELLRALDAGPLSQGDGYSVSRAIDIPCVLGRDACPPPYATPGSAGADLAAWPEADLILTPGETAVLPTGVSIQLPGPDWVGLVAIRSGIGLRGLQLCNGVGVVDSDYRGELRLAVVNRGDANFSVQRGDRIAQLLILPAAQARFLPADRLDDTGRGTGGYGSTGR